MKIYDKSRVFRGTNEDGDPRFLHTAVVYGDGRDIFHATITDGSVGLDEINVNEVQGVRIPPEKVFPKFDPEAFTVAPSPSSDACYVKLPSMTLYDPDRDNKSIGDAMLGEALVCEALKGSPHPNVAKYLGCKKDGPLMTGLCFERYSETLSERLRRDGSRLNRRVCVEGIRKGIEHIHAQGQCHNDINPRNIMFGTGDTPVIIDFDSCQPTGHKLGYKHGTQEFWDDTAELSETRNDFYSLTKIEEFLDKAEC